MTIVNEMLTLFCCYVFTTFNIVNPEFNFKLGYLLIFVLGTYMVIILLSAIFNSIKDLKKKLRLRSLRRAYKKSRAKLQNDLKINHETNAKV